MELVLHHRELLCQEQEACVNYYAKNKREGTLTLKIGYV
jgi:hypothetical protein